MEAPESAPQAPLQHVTSAGSRAASRGQGGPGQPLFGRSLVTSVLVHGTVLCCAALLTPGVREAAGRAWNDTTLVFADPLKAPENLAATEETWEQVTAEEPPEPELVEVPMEPAVEEPLEDEPELEPMEDAERMWARVEPGPIARAKAPAVDPGPSLPPAVQPVDLGDAVAEAPVAPAATAPVLVAAPPPEYPAVARRLGLEGSVLLRLHISPRGKLLRCELVEGSGSDRLDNAAIEAVGSWTFLPATSGGGATEGTLLHRVTFGLEA